MEKALQAVTLILIIFILTAHYTIKYWRKQGIQEPRIILFMFMAFFSVYVSFAILDLTGVEIKTMPAYFVVYGSVSEAILNIFCTILQVDRLEDKKDVKKI